MCKDPEMSLDLFGNQELPNVWGGGWWVGRSSCRRSPSHLPSWKGSELENRSGHCRGRVWERSNDVMEEGKEALSWDSKFKKKKRKSLSLFSFCCDQRSVKDDSKQEHVGFILAQQLRVQASWQDTHGIWSTRWLLWHPQPGNQEAWVLVFAWLFSSTWSRTSCHGAMAPTMLSYQVDNHYSTSYFPLDLVPSEIMS